MSTDTQTGDRPMILVRDERMLSGPSMLRANVTHYGMFLVAGLLSCAPASQPRDTTPPVPPPPPAGGVDASSNTPDPDAAPADPDAEPAEPDAAPPDPPDAGFAMDAAVPELCPPSGPFGINVGQTLPDLELSDCSGNVHHLHDLCDAKASYFFVYAGW